jgi:outer membrane protein, multidrug efflux system
MPERQPLAWLEERALGANAQWAFAQADAARQRAGQHTNSLTQGRRAMAQALAAAPSDVTGQSIPLLSGRTPWNHSTETTLQAQADAEILERRIRADVHMAHATYESARTQADHSRHEVLRLHTALQQESLLRYNGMLKSTWDLLASARQRIQSVDAAHQAQRQAWLAWADLQAVLNGLPYTSSLSTASSTPTPPTAGH